MNTLRTSARVISSSEAQCDIILEDAGFTPRATKNFDIILIVEALDPVFLKQFWAFIVEGNYSQKEKSHEERKYYRFLNPENKVFQQLLEVFNLE